jgi:hypothetical protein
VTAAGNLCELVEVVQDMQYLVLRGEVHDRPVREHALHGLRGYFPLPRSVEIVGDEETATEQVLAQPGRLGIGEGPTADLLGEQPRIVEDLLVREAQVAAIVGDVDARQAPYTLPEVIFRLRVVDRPPWPAESGAESAAPAAAVDHAGDVQLAFGACVGSDTLAQTLAVRGLAVRQMQRSARREEHRQRLQRGAPGARVAAIRNPHATDYR